MTDRECHYCDVRPRQTMHNRRNCYKCANPDCPYHDTILGMNIEQIKTARHYLYHDYHQVRDWVRAKEPAT